LELPQTRFRQKQLEKTYRGNSPGREFLVPRIKFRKSG